MIRINSSNEILYPVTAHMLENGTGKTKEHTFKIRYKLLSRTELREQLNKQVNIATDNIDSLREAIRKQSDPKELSRHDAWLKSHINGWEDILGEDGEPLEFNDENYQLVMNIIPIASAIDNGLMAASREEPAKN
ncbi:MAG: hypothetical protein HUJ30_02425 [Gammaproteobacteria bacterium]|nr:hypothetical protein [Gammaproteobacteria bacterium]